MTLKRPIWMQAGGGDSPFEYSGLDLRALLRGLMHQEGIAAPDVVFGALKVSQRAAGANFSVDIAAGLCVINGDDVSDQGMYMCHSTAIENRTIPAPPVSGSRTHRVVAQVKDKLHEGTWSSYEWDIVVLEDTGSGTPAVPDSAISLATVTVTSVTTSILNANIADTRTSAATIGAKPPFAAADADRQPNPYESEQVWRTVGKDIEVWDGSAWRPAGLNRPAARLTRITTNQSIPNSTATALQWNAEAEDTHGGHDNSTNPSRYTAPIAGLYLVSATVTWDQNASGIREIGLRVGGTTTYDGSRVVNGSNITHVQSVSHLIRLNAGEYVEAVVSQTSGGALAVDRTFHSGPLMDVCWMRP